MAVPNIHKLKHIKEAAIEKQLVNVGKHRVLAEIGRRQEARNATRLSAYESMRLFSMRVVRKMIPTNQVLAGIILVIMLSTSTSLIAQAAVPGDVLWPIKITIEKAEVALAVDSAYESRVHLRHVDNRLKELSVIVLRSKTGVKNSENISRVVRRLEQDITAANQSLKVSKDEKQATQPDVILALAKDVNDKASEAVKILEENKLTLAAVSIEDSNASDSDDTTTSTTDIVNGDDASTTRDGLAVIDAGETAEEVAADAAAKVIAEVQLVHQNVSYDALEAMIELIEKQHATNRGEAKAILNEKIVEQRMRMDEPLDQVDWISNNFILHRREVQALLDESDTLLSQAADLTVLDNLSGSFKRLVTARGDIDRMNPILEEVSEADGYIPRPIEEKMVPVEVFEPAEPEVTMQAVELPEEEVELPPEIVPVATE